MLRNAKCCPGCGADERSGWSESAYCDNLGIPEEHFDYDKFVAEEFRPARVKPRGIHWLWWCTAVGLTGLLLFLYLR